MQTECVAQMTHWYVTSQMQLARATEVQGTKQKPATCMVAEVAPSLYSCSFSKHLLTLTMVFQVWLSSLYLEDKKMMLESERTEDAHLGILTPECKLMMPEKHFLISNLKNFSYLVPDDKSRKRSHSHAHLLPLPYGCLLKAVSSGLLLPIGSLYPCTSHPATGEVAVEIILCTVGLLAASLTSIQ